MVLQLFKRIVKARVVIDAFAFCLFSFMCSIHSIAFPSAPRNLQQETDVCVKAMAPPGSTLSKSLKDKLAQAISNDHVKVDGVLRALSTACRTDFIDLSPNGKYVRLKQLLDQAREEFEAKGAITNGTFSSLEQDVGVTKEDMRNPHGQIIGWQLVIDKRTKDEMKIRTAASLASNGYLFIEAFHQLTAFGDFELERKVLLDGIERTAKTILDYPDENGDGRFGWGRLWFKGKDGLVLHSSLQEHNMYFGGYTYFPRINSLGQSTCEKSLPLKEEAFDQAHNTLFLLEAFLVTRDKTLAKMILFTVGKAFDDTLDEGGPHKQLGPEGWYYWKQLGKQRQANQVECEVGREIKNTNLRMGLALLAFSEIVRRNRKDLEGDTGLSFNPEKYLDRAMRVIRTNNYEGFENNNYGYQGANSRDVELIQEPDRKPLVYDRTQITVGLESDIVGDLKDVITAGNKALNKPVPSSVTICGGTAGMPVRDRGIAGSCWNHLPFEAEDYFRIARFSNGWLNASSVRLRDLLDALTRNLAAAKILHNGRESRYAHYFPNTVEKVVSNEVVNASFYGFFCMARNLPKQSAVANLPEAHRKILGNLARICETMPQESGDTGVTWRKGYKFYELYLAADRFSIPEEDWHLANKR